MPYYPIEEEDRGYNYRVQTMEQKLICDYTGLNILEVLDMSFILYRVLWVDAYIYKLEQTEQGQEYLKKAFILKQSKPDREKLRNTFN